MKTIFQSDNPDLPLQLAIAYDKLERATTEVVTLRDAILSIRVYEDDWCPWCASHASMGHALGCIYPRLEQDREVVRNIEKLDKPQSA